jgi:hypothetical protein
LQINCPVPPAAPGHSGRWGVGSPLAGVIGIGGQPLSFRHSRCDFPIMAEPDPAMPATAASQRAWKRGNRRQITGSSAVTTMKTSRAPE